MISTHLTSFSTPEWDISFDRLLNDIERNQCILLIGPEIVKNKDGVLVRELLRKHLEATNPADILHYYERDGFYLFKDDTSKEDVQREVVRFYKNERQLDIDLLLQLVRLKTHLIISINPDSYLSDIAWEHGIQHRHVYFQHGGEAVLEVEAPTSNEPLIYNLFGSLKRDDSLVLDYDDCYSMLKSLLGFPGLPLGLSGILNKRNAANSTNYAKHLLFVGFDFDKWYSQLLLKVLSEKSARKFAIDPTEKTANTTTFLEHQFHLQFIENEEVFFSELFRRAEERGLMRETITDRSPLATKVIKDVINGNLKSAIQHLNSHAALQQEVILLESQLNELQKRKYEIDDRDYSTQYNRISSSILRLANDC